MLGIARAPGRIRGRRARHLVQHPARGRDGPSQLFCTPGRPARNLSVTSLPVFLAEPAAFDLEHFGAQQPPGAYAPSNQLETRDRDVVDLAALVLVRVTSRLPSVDHPPPQVVERGAPQHGLLAARVHCDVAADARCVERGRIDREHVAGRFRRLGHAARDDARAGEDRRHLVRDTRQLGQLDRAELLELSVLMTAENGVSGTAPPVAVPPRGITVRPSSKQALMRPAISASLSGSARRTGIRHASRSRRSRATRATARRNGCCPSAQRPSALRGGAGRPSSRIRRRTVDRTARRFRVSRRAMRARGASSRCCEIRAAALADFGEAVVQRSISSARRLSSRSSCRYGLRRTTQMSPSTSYSIRAERARTALGAQFVEHRPRLRRAGGSRSRDPRRT